MNYSLLLTEEEVNDLINTTLSNTRDYLMVRLMFEHGVYEQELKSIKLNDLNLHRGILSTGSKNKHRTIYLSKDLIPIFDKYLSNLNPNEENLFLTERNKPFSLKSHSFSKTLNNYAKMAGINKPLSSKLIRLTYIHLKILKNPQCWEQISLELGHSNYFRTKMFFLNNIK